MVYLLLNIGGKNFRRKDRRRAWGPKNGLVRAVVSYFGILDDCLAEQMHKFAVRIISKPLPPSLYP